MGNRTRRQHNTRGKSPIVATLEAAQASATLEFPFHDVDRITAAFGVGIPGYDKVLAAIPVEYRNYRNPWCQYAEHCFFGGANLRSWRWRNPALKDRQLRYLKAWLGSFEPSHEDKEAVCGWLLSLMLLECPKD